MSVDIEQPERIGEKESVVQSPQAAQVEQQLEKMKKGKNEREAQVLATQTHLMDPNFVHWQSSFTNFLMTWLVRMVDPTNRHPAVPIELPLPESTNEAFNMLPEWLFEDAIGFFNFLSRYVQISFGREGN